MTSTRSTSRPPACGARRRSLVRSAGGIAITSGSAPSGRRHDQLRRHLLPIGHHGRQHRRLVVADAGHRNVEQRVEQLALALLELAGDHDPDLRIGDAHPGPREPLDQVAALVVLGDLLGVVDQLDDDLHLAGVIGLRHGALWGSHGRRANWRGPMNDPRQLRSCRRVDQNTSTSDGGCVDVVSIPVLSRSRVVVVAGIDVRRVAGSDRGHVRRPMLDVDVRRLSSTSLRRRRGLPRRPRC